MSRKYVKVFYDWKNQMAALSDAEKGRLYDAILEYGSTGQAPVLTGRESILFPVFQSQIDRDYTAYDALCRARSTAGKLGAAARWQTSSSCGKNGNSYKSHGKNGKCHIQHGKNGEDKEEDKDKDKDKDILPPNGGRRARAKAGKKSFGTYGWVKLTDSEYNRLLHDIGETEVKRCIAYIDESAQSSANKNGWKDWNLVIRRCHRDGWGLKNSRQMQPTTNTQPSKERIRKNADWLDEFLSKQGGGR